MTDRDVCRLERLHAEDIHPDRMTGEGGSGVETHVSWASGVMLTLSTILGLASGYMAFRPYQKVERVKHVNSRLAYF